MSGRCCFTACSWTSVGGQAGNTQIFAPNGHFASIAHYQYYEASSTPGMVWHVDRGWQGDGPYEVHGDRLHTENAKASDAEHDVTRLFSIVRVPSDKRPGSYHWVLRTVERSFNGTQTFGFSPGGNFVTHMTLAPQP